MRKARPVQMSSAPDMTGPRRRRCRWRRGDRGSGARDGIARARWAAVPRRGGRRWRAPPRRRHRPPWSATVVGSWGPRSRRRVVDIGFEVGVGRVVAAPRCRRAGVRRRSWRSRRVGGVGAGLLVERGVGAMPSASVAGAVDRTASSTPGAGRGAPAGWEAPAGPRRRRESGRNSSHPPRAISPTGTASRAAATTSRPR